MRIGFRQEQKREAIGVPAEKLNSERGDEVEYVLLSPIDLSFHQSISCRLQLKIQNYRN